MIKTVAQRRASNPAQGYSPQVWRSATRGQLKGWLGLSLAALSSRGATHVPARVGYARRARSRRGHRAQPARGMAWWCIRRWPGGG
jgi:hypothetical protein